MSEGTTGWEGPCPECGCHAEVELDCPGRGSPVIVCYPSCGNTEVVTCSSPDCQYWYSPERRRSNYRPRPMGEKPSWFKRWSWPGSEDDE